VQPAAAQKLTSEEPLSAEQFVWVPPQLADPDVVHPGQYVPPQ
jgi:hypothetical protein